MDIWKSQLNSQGLRQLVLKVIELIVSRSLSVLHMYMGVHTHTHTCLLYTSDAADDWLVV